MVLRAELFSTLLVAGPLQPIGYVAPSSSVQLGIRESKRVMEDGEVEENCLSLLSLLCPSSHAVQMLVSNTPASVSLSAACE